MATSGRAPSALARSLSARSDYHAPIAPRLRGARSVSVENELWFSSVVFPRREVDWSAAFAGADDDPVIGAADDAAVSDDAPLRVGRDAVRYVAGGRNSTLAQFRLDGSSPLGGGNDDDGDGEFSLFYGAHNLEQISDDDGGNADDRDANVGGGGASEQQRFLLFDNGFDPLAGITRHNTSRLLMLEVPTPRRSRGRGARLRIRIGRLLEHTSLRIGRPNHHSERTVARSTPRAARCVSSGRSTSATHRSSTATRTSRRAARCSAARVRCSAVALSSCATRCLRATSSLPGARLLVAGDARGRRRELRRAGAARRADARARRRRGRVERSLLERARRQRLRRVPVRARFREPAAGLGDVRRSFSCLSVG